MVVVAVRRAEFFEQTGDFGVTRGVKRTACEGFVDEAVGGGFARGIRAAQLAVGIDEFEGIEQGSAVVTRAAAAVAAGKEVQDAVEGEAVRLFFQFAQGVQRAHEVDGAAFATPVLQVVEQGGDAVAVEAAVCFGDVPQSLLELLDVGFETDEVFVAQAFSAKGVTAAVGRISRAFVSADEDVDEVGGLDVVARVVGGEGGQAGEGKGATGGVQGTGHAVLRYEGCAAL